MIDLVELKSEIENGVFIPFVKRDKVYLTDSENGETILVCDLKEVESEKPVF
jgi:hypothetical protein